MTQLDKRSTAIINAAEKAIAKISDPKARAEAIAELKATRKRLARSAQPQHREAPRSQKSRDRDFDYDR